MTIQNATTLPPAMTMLNQGVDRLSAQYTAESAAVASEVTSDSYAGLGDQRYQALDLQPQITRVAAWQQNITSAQNTLEVTQTAMSRITTIATNLSTSLTSLQGDTSTTNIDAAAVQARQSLSELSSLLNTTDGTGYVFGGTASDTAPVTNPSAILSSSFFTTIGNSVAAVATTGAASVDAATLAEASDADPAQSVFSLALSVDPVTAAGIGRTVTVDDQDHVAFGFVASQGVAATATSTGSSIRDLMRALAVVGNLDQVTGSSTGLSSLISDTGTQVAAVSSSLVLSVAAVGQTQAQLTQQTSSLSLMSDSLEKQLGVTKDSDPASLSSQITDTQNQLQASYTLIADMKNMSLAAYI